MSDPLDMLLCFHMVMLLGCIGAVAGYCLAQPLEINDSCYYKSYLISYK